VRYPALLLLVATLVSLSANRNFRYNFSHALDFKESAWVDSVYNSMPDTLRIAQLMTIRATDERSPKYEQEVEGLVKRYQVGGICLFQGSPEMLAELTNRCQAASSVPLMVSIDAEWGLGMRLKETTIAYPKQLMLGAIQDNYLVYEFGAEVGRQCKRMGIHLNFAPVADINNNPENPVINDRSFGEDRSNVTAKCIEYMRGMQAAGIMACAKHFPGHGDTNTDSHLDLPVIAHNLQRLDSLELYPFRAMARSGIGSFMVAHLNIPALDNRPNRPTTLSRAAIYDLLRTKMGYDGLIVTDAMEMQGVAKYFAPGLAEVEALKAGNDVILLPGDVGAAIKAVQNALNTGEYARAEFEVSVKRVLRAKYRLGLTKPQRVDLNNLRQDLNRPQAQLLKRKLIENALTLVRDAQNLVGFDSLEHYNFATLALGDTNQTVFQTTCGYYAPMTHFNAPKVIDSLRNAQLIEQLRPFNVILLSLHQMRSRSADNFGITTEEVLLIQQLCKQHTVVLTVFGNPYSLKYFNEPQVLLQAYNEDPMTQRVAAQGLFGALDFKGKLPISASLSAYFGQGIRTQFPEKRLAYDIPESVGMNSDTLAQMDALVQEMIAAGAAPGCQIVVARNNRVIWQKSYGHFTYEPTTPVRNDHLYDIASVTKIAATTLCAMQLYDAGKIKLDTEIGKYLPELANTNKEKLKLRDILAHHARLQPWIPFYQKTLENGLPNAHIYHRQLDEDSQIPVAPDMYMDNNWVDTVWNSIFLSPLRSEKGYKYSDLGLYLTARTIERVSNQKLDEYAQQQFYKPLGLRATFNPWQLGLSAQCVPTEEDRYFRQQRIQGYVHDMGAAMLGGVSGHAGLFSNANDLAKIFQLFLNGGSYFGKQYIRPESVNTWTIRYPGSTRRGIAFDMKELDPKATGNMSEKAGPNTFGHTGFTGICAWADPDQNLIFIFCSNRTYPTMENNKLISGNYRPRLQSIIYQSIKK
jgi:beta-glucosidase-like glycosyl hydrolase/CubicO group peptidase (beta-lactamase class C family)